MENKSGNQRYICRFCKKNRIESYSDQEYKPDIDKTIIQFTKEELTSTARILKISTTTLLKRIISIARSIAKPIISKGKTYEVDELCTYIRHKKNYIWLVYALEKKSKAVVSFNLGKRANKTLSRVLDTLKLSETKKIFTDRLKNYRYLINKELHSVKRMAQTILNGKFDSQNSSQRLTDGQSASVKV